MSDRFDLQRFVDAQAKLYTQVTAEHRQGRKESHWMWFIFPQIAGLGHSPTAQRFAIASRDEAAAYAAHDILGPRLMECTKLLLAVPNLSIRQILGSPDDLKFRSSMTLFEAATEHPEFGQAIEKFYFGKRDQATLDILTASASRI